MDQNRVVPDDMVCTKRHQQNGDRRNINEGTNEQKVSYYCHFRSNEKQSRREMVLNFGPIVTGYYNDKVKQEKIQIIDTTRTSYFDSNLYPALIAWLPLKEGYTQDLSIYDYNPSGTIGVIGAFIQMVSSGRYQSIRSGLRDVWVTTVRDEIGGDKHQSSMTYYIDKADRRLWKQEINIGTRKMLMLRKEEQ